MKKIAATRKVRSRAADEKFYGILHFDFHQIKIHQLRGVVVLRLQKSEPVPGVKIRRSTVCVERDESASCFVVRNKIYFYEP